MVDQSIRRIIRKYLLALQENGLPIAFGIVFGSQTNGNTHQWSDIDLLVVSPRFDTPYRHKDVDFLWKTTIGLDSRIEPIPCGVRQWEKDDVSALIEMARREGEVITLEPVEEPLPA